MGQEDLSARRHDGRRDRRALYNPALIASWAAFSRVITSTTVVRRDRSFCCRALRAATAGISLALMIAGCSYLQPSTETGPEGTRNLSDPGEGEQNKTKEQIVEALGRGLAGYRVMPGDVLEVLYLSSNQPQPTEYVVGVGDRLRIEFHYVEEAPRTVLVRPDGRITLPLKGEVMAAGRTPAQLTESLQKLYADIFRDPRISVSVEQFTSKIDDLRVSLTNLQRGRSQRVVLSPDGMAYLPFLPGLRLSGLTVDEAREVINTKYAREFGNLQVSVLLDTAAGNRVFVFGEVARPGIVQLTSPMTVLQALASAGGHLPTGSLADVRVLYWRKDEKQPLLRTINLENVIERRRLNEDMVLPANSTIYVPPTGITRANRFVDQFLRQLFLFTGTSISFQRTF